MCENYFVLAGQPKQFDPHRWHADETDRAWIRLIHGFSWLADLKAVGGDAGRRHARDMVTSWIETYSHWHTLTWQPDLTGERLANWIGFYNFYGETAHIDFQDDLRECMMKQARHLAQAFLNSTIQLCRRLNADEMEDMHYGHQRVDLCGSSLR